MPKTQRIYLAARYSRRIEICRYRNMLETHGFKAHCEWLLGNHQWNPIAAQAETAKDTVPIEAGEFAQDDLRDLSAADTLIAFTDPPRSKASRGGRHVEFGYALAMRKRIIIVGPRENVFYWLPQVERFDTFDQNLIAHLKQVPFDA